MIEFTSAMATATIAYISLLWNDLSTLLLIIFGVGIGLMILEAVVWAIKKH